MFKSTPGAKKMTFTYFDIYVLNSLSDLATADTVT